MSVQRKRRSYVQRQLHRELLRFLKAQRLLLIQSTAAAVCVCVVPVLIGSPAYTTGFTHALMLTAMLSIFAFAFLFAGGGALLLAGSYGEAYTQEELDRAIKAGRVWSVVHNIELVTMDIDHLVLSPAGVLALETKWRFKGAHRQWLGVAVEQADATARKARSVLRSRDIGHVTQVRPVLVVWGGGRRDLPDAQVVSGVDVVRVDALADWLRRCDRGLLAQDHAEVLHQRLTSFARARRAAMAP